MDGLPLRDIHLPAPVSWWPPAPGWWLLAGVLVALIILWFRRRSQLKVRRAGLRSLTEIEREFRAHGDGQRLSADVSTLLRRVCLTYLPRESVASLTGKAWRDAMASVVASRGVLSDKVAWQIVHGPYNPSQEVEGATMVDQVRRWLGALPPLRRAR
ncbi:MAG: DUF4381 domain-containing protein [Gammaproteobacteria bacterium]